jgi:hypothetical protein
VTGVWLRPRGGRVMHLAVATVEPQQEHAARQLCSAIGLRPADTRAACGMAFVAADRPDGPSVTRCPRCEARSGALPSPPMAEGHGGARKGAGRPRTVGGEDTRVLTVRVAVPDDLAELDALVADGVAGDVSGAIRHLIRESAKRRARRKRP